MRQNQGKQLGKYRLLCELGRGGMAAVHLALASGPAGFNKLVVLKVILPELAGEPEFVEMFLDEARLAARLNHPNVVQTNEVGQEGKQHFIAMEYLEGQTMQRVLTRLGFGKNPRFTRAMQLRLLCDALVGLHHAHELADFDGRPLGVVHRDVSPHNVFVTYAGQVKVLDFGIAKALSSTSQTVTGTLKGKLGYMAPEQARGDRVQRQADIYSAGVMLWELLVGQRLFKGVPDVQVLQRLGANEIPRPSQVDPNVDPELEAIVVRAMAYRAEERFATAAELGEVLEEYLRARGAAVTGREVGQLVAAEFAEERAGMRALIEQSLAELPRTEGEGLVAGGRMSRPDEVLVVPAPSPSAAAAGGPSVGGPSRAGHEVSAPPSSSEAAAQAGPPSAATVVDASRTRVPSIPDYPPPRRMPLAVVAGACLAVASLAVGALVLLGRAPAGEASATGGGVDPASAAELTVTLATRPPGARVRCMGELVGTTPMTIKVKRGATLPCAYVLAAEGYEPHEVERTAVTAELPPIELRPIEAAPPGPSSHGAASTPPPFPGVRPRVGGTATTAATSAPLPPASDIRLRR